MNLRSSLLAAAVFPLFAGTALAAGKPVPPPAPKAAATKAPASQCGDEASCTKECDAKIPAACNKLGVLIHMENDGRDEKAAAAWGKACDGHLVTACLEAGQLYVDGSGVDADGAKAADLFKRACDGNEMRGCLQLALIIRAENGVPKNPKRAAQLLQRACDGAIPEACVELSDMYEDGEGVAKDPKHGIRLLDRACEAGDGAGCRILGIRFEDGIGVDDDAAKALSLYKRACSHSDESGCLKAKELAKEIGSDGNDAAVDPMPAAASASPTPKKKRGDDMLEPLPTPDSPSGKVPDELVDPFGADKPRVRTSPTPSPSPKGTPEDDVPDPFQ